MKTLKKQDLAQWLVNENNDCGKDTYFSEDRRTAMSIDDSFKKFMKMTKDELISIIYVFSEEGQKFLEEKSYLKTLMASNPLKFENCIIVDENAK